MHIGDWLGRRAALTPDRLALVDPAGRRITYAAWNRTANRTAHLLRGRLGVRRGDRVAVLGYNTVEHLDLLFALGKIGGVLLNLSWRLLPAELLPLIEAAAPVALAYGAECRETVAALRGQLPGVRTFIALGEPACGDDLPLSARDACADGPPDEVALSWEDPWVICPTGGSSGLPRGAVLSHRAITANAVNTIISWGLRPDDVALLDAPLFHTGGLNVFTTPLVYLGGASIVRPRFDPEESLRQLASREVSLYFGVPTMHQLLQEQPGFATADLSRLRILISGGAPCPPPVFERYLARGLPFRTGYGLTEAGPNNFWLPDSFAQHKPGSVGAPLFHVDARICREDGTHCPPGETGELLLSGPHLFSGYLGDPQATAEVLRRCNGTPWLHTGDLACHDEDGHVSIVGRRKEMFISGGENVYPAEIEAALCSHPAVREAAVIGVPDPRWGEVGHAAVVLHPGQDASPETLLAFLRGRLASFKLPRTVSFLDALPRTGAGKVDRRQLARQARQGKKPT